MDDRARLVLERLDALRISYDYIEHDAAAHMDECRAIEERLGAMVPRNLFLTTRRQGGFYLYVLRPGTPFRSGDVSRQAGTSRLCFAGEDALYDHLRVRPGSVTPLGLIFDADDSVKLLMDRALRDEARLIFHPCVNTASVAMSTRDFLEVFLPAVHKTPVFIEVDA